VEFFGDVRRQQQGDPLRRGARIGGAAVGPNASSEALRLVFFTARSRSLASTRWSCGSLLISALGFFFVGAF
jgi:hypothetical protein